ncbi:MAG: class I SAM-dependent methyltransferase [Bacteroidetes bacterium]|nr:class I SAM-dependent methyltransferase [Bacteroidota bacterium]
MNCRFCGNTLMHDFADLGSCPPSNSFFGKEDMDKPERCYPLKLFVCSVCFLVQVAEYIKANEIFNNNYIYFSSYSQSWLEHAKQYTDMIVDRFGFNGNSRVIEIASNDGYLLQYFKLKNIPVLGIEPAANTAAEAEKKGIETVIDFFGVNLAKELSGQMKKADLLIGNNVLAHVPDINDFVAGMKIILKPDGIITMEFPHIVRMIGNNQFDTIYHEHFSYFSFTTVCAVFGKHGLEIFDVDEIPTHGGSLRIYAKHHGNSLWQNNKQVNMLCTREETLGITSIEYYGAFQKKIEKVKSDVILFLQNAKSLNKKIAAYGAAAKGNTLLNYCDIKAELVKFVADTSPHKVGKYLPGSHIPVVREEKIREEKPDYILILPWNIRDEIIKQLSYIKAWGGKFVTAIPQITIY